MVVKAKARRPEAFDETFVRDLSEAVYRDRLGGKDTSKVIKEHGETTLRKRASVYDPITKAYLRALREFGQWPPKE